MDGHMASPHKEEPFFRFAFLSGRRLHGRSLNAIGRMEAAVSRHKELAVRQCRAGRSVVAIVLPSVSAARLALYGTSDHLYSVVFQPVATRQEIRTEELLACTCGEW
jgi:hypothetical protein